MKSNTPKSVAASFVCIADTPCANGSCCDPTVQQLKGSTVKIYVNHFLVVLGVLRTRFVFVNRYCLKAVSRSLSMQENLHLNCSTGISWCNAPGLAAGTSSAGMTYLPLYFRDRQRPCPIKNTPDWVFLTHMFFLCHFWAVILSCVLLVLCVLSRLSISGCVRECIW